MDNQMLLVVDNLDKFIEYERRDLCHSGQGVHHRALVVLLENKNGEVLLQKRKHKLWDGFWDITATTHPLHIGDRDESYEEAGARALKNELGIVNINLKKIGGFNYFAKENEYCENEYCAILEGNYNGKITPDLNSVYEYKWIPKKDFISKCLKDNSDYTPWAILTGKQYER